MLASLLLCWLACVGLGRLAFHVMVWHCLLCFWDFGASSTGVQVLFLVGLALVVGSISCKLLWHGPLLRGSVLVGVFCYPMLGGAFFWCFVVLVGVRVRVTELVEPLLVL